MKWGFGPLFGASMLVRVKETQVEGFYGFYGLERRYPGDEFTLVPKKDNAGKVISTAENQFSDRWMEKVDKRKKSFRDESPADSSTSVLAQA